MKSRFIISVTGCVVLAALLVVCAPVLSSSERTESTTWDHDSDLWVDAELVEEAAATFTEAELAPIGGVCNTNIGSGICQAESQCHGQLFSGLCAGSASIKCCVVQGASTKSAPAATSAAASAAHACSSNGKAGLCLPVSSCSTGQTVSGLCPGNASIKCCIGATASSATTTTAPVAGGKACSYKGKPGACIPTSQCKGSTVSGLCPGSADIKCCLGATASSGAAPTLALAAASGSCSWAGKQGSCVDFRACQGTSFTGLCPGSANIRCCVPGPKTKPRFVQQLSKAKPLQFIPQPKLRSVAERKALEEHKQKYDRFTRLHPNKARKDGSDFARFMSNRNTIIKLNQAFGTEAHPTPFGSKSPFANMSPSEFRARYLRASHPNQKRHNASNAGPAKKKSVSVRRTANAAKPQLKTKGGSALLEMGDPKTGDGGVAGWGGQTGKKSGKTGGDSGDTASKSGKTGGADGDDAQKSGKTGGADDLSMDDSIRKYLPTWNRDYADDKIGYNPMPRSYGHDRNGGFSNMVVRDDVKQSLLKAGVPQVDVDSTWAILSTFASQMSLPGGSDDQGICGSCWANAATLSAAQIARLYYPNDYSAGRVSVQQVLDCVKTENSNGCNGGTPMDALDYMANYKNALASDDLYPRRDDLLTGDCQIQQSPDIGPNFRPRGWRFAVLPCTTALCENQQAKEIELLRRIYEEKVSIIVYIDATNWSQYTGGIFPTQLCSSSLEAGNHVAILSVWGSPSQQKGYETYPPYWRITNSWGSQWGDQGEIYLPFGVNACGLANYAITAAPIPNMPIINLLLEPDRMHHVGESDDDYQARIAAEPAQRLAKYNKEHIPFPLTKSYY